MRTIVCLSGGKASAWCADWALKHCQNVMLYFNDTKWEHADLYRFLDDLENYFNQSIIRDSDGRSPETLAYDHHALPSNRMPFCSSVLKAERLQRFIQDGDTLIFGIGDNEAHRALRISEVYKAVAQRKRVTINCRFPLIETITTSRDVDYWLSTTNIQEPELYTNGFSHNNCSGGCVRQGKSQWKKLLLKYPDVFAEREEFEEGFREEFGKDVHFMKDLTLKQLRMEIEANGNLFDGDTGDEVTECIGICGLQN